MASPPSRTQGRHGFLSCLLATAATSVPWATGCHSAFVNASVVNQTGGSVSLIEVDYPSASFGTETLAAGATYHYRFKILGSGPTKVTWTDSAHAEHSAAGPVLHEDQEGSILIQLNPSGAQWSPALGR